MSMLGNCQDAVSVILSPFSNSAIRDWPAEHFSTLIAKLLEGAGSHLMVDVVGTAAQRLGGNEIVRPYPSTHVRNLCGRLTWQQLVVHLRQARCMIGNNSGLAHLSAYFGVPTVCVFGGSHQRAEWHPRGDNVVIVSRAIGCSPCQLDHGATSPYNKACLAEIDPGDVARAATIAIARAGSAPLTARPERPNMG